MSRHFSYREPRYPRGHNYRPRKRLRVGRLIIVILIFAAVIAGIIFGVLFLTKQGPFASGISTPEPSAAPSAEETAAAAPSSTPTPSAAPTIDPGNFTVAAVDSTLPSAFGFQTEIEQDGAAVAEYTRTRPISFPAASDYTGIKGITTFRSNNYRDQGAFGSADITDKKLEKLWSQNGTAVEPAGINSSAQPLIAQWDTDIRQMMNLYSDKKSDDGLIEVIYPAMDGKIYFMDLSDGSYTRDPINTGFAVTGTAALDPRGYPLLYVGQGTGLSGTDQHDNVYLYVYSLIDGQLLYKYGAEQKDPFAYRESWQAYSGSPLVAADADTLVWVGENGILYTAVLNSEFDRAAGTVSINPDTPVKYRYTTPKNADDAQLSADTPRKYGAVASAAAWKNYLFLTDSGGWLQCIDLNTMTPVYVQDLITATDASPLLEQTQDGLFLYVASKASLQPQEGQKGTAYLRKINALTGEIIWQTPYDCLSSGGASATPVLGTGTLSDMVFFTVAQTDASQENGKLVALNTDTGEMIWEHEMDRYGLSSPVAVYTQDNTGYLLQGNSNGIMTLLDGKTGEALDRVSLGGTIVSTPAVMGDMLVVGSSNGSINGIRIK